MVYRDNDNRVLPNKVPRSPIKLTEDIKEYLLKESTLERWKCKSMNERCHIIEEEKNVSISRTLLARFYKRNKIRRVVPCYKLFRRRSDAEHLELQ